MIIVLESVSKRADVTPGWLARVAAAVTIQLGAVCAEYGLGSWSIGIGNYPSSLPRLVVFDTSDDPGALGYHDTTPDGAPYGRAFADGQDLDGLSTTISHEALEMVGDIDADEYVVGGDGRVRAKELCDPCEDVTYEENGVRVSDWVTRAWFEVGKKQPAGRRFCHTGALRAAGERTGGGYVIEMVGGEMITDPPMAILVPQKPRKAAAGSRLNRRLAHGRSEPGEASQEGRRTCSWAGKRVRGDVVVVAGDHERRTDDGTYPEVAEERAKVEARAAAPAAEVHEVAKTPIAVSGLVSRRTCAKPSDAGTPCALEYEHAAPLHRGDDGSAWA